MLEKNSIEELRTLEKYFTDLFIDIHRNTEVIPQIKDDILAKDAISEYVMSQIDKLRERIFLTEREGLWPIGDRLTKLTMEMIDNVVNMAKNEEADKKE